MQTQLVIGHFRVQSKCESIHLEMSLFCIRMKLQSKHIFIWMVSHVDSFWCWGKRELGKGLRYPGDYANYSIGRFYSCDQQQIYCNKRKCLKRVELPQDWFVMPTWPLFHCFGTPICLLWRHVPKLYSSLVGDAADIFVIEIKSN